jgi:hypothetical protein
MRVEPLTDLKGGAITLCRVTRRLERAIRGDDPEPSERRCRSCELHGRERADLLSDGDDRGRSQCSRRADKRELVSAFHRMPHQTTQARTKHMTTQSSERTTIKRSFFIGAW